MGSILGGNGKRMLWNWRNGGASMQSTRIRHFLSSVKRAALQRSAQSIRLNRFSSAPYCNRFSIMHSNELESASYIVHICIILGVSMFDHLLQSEMQYNWLVHTTMPWNTVLCTEIHCTEIHHNARYTLFFILQYSWQRFWKKYTPFHVVHLDFESAQRHKHKYTSTKNTNTQMHAITVDLDLESAQTQ